MYLGYCSPKIWGIQSSSFNSITPNLVNCVLFTQVTIKYFENTILTLAAPEFKFKRIVIEKRFLF